MTGLAIRKDPPPCPPPQGGRENAVALSSQDDEALRQRVRRVLEGVVDPELPFLSLADLGVLREVRVAGGAVVVVITPTYTGCPAVEVIRFEILRTLAEAGVPDARIETVLSPPWTTDWLSDAARARLRAHGIAPPERASTSRRALLGEVEPIACPQCGSRATELVSAFGATACKALHRCTDCLEPFEAFKCI
jgi:ring-1,2-phenylacetyl-CoA epoxidase subunit PaaD